MSDPTVAADNPGTFQALWQEHWGIVTHRCIGEQLRLLDSEQGKQHALPRVFSARALTKRCAHGPTGASAKS